MVNFYSIAKQKIIYTNKSVNTPYINRKINDLAIILKTIFENQGGAALSSIIEKSSILNINIENADLSGLVLDHGDGHKPIDFAHINFSGSNFTNAKFSYVNFDNCNLNGVIFSKAKFNRCSFKNAKFNNVTLNRESLLSLKNSKHLPEKFNKWMMLT